MAEASIPSPFNALQPLRPEEHGPAYGGLLISALTAFAGQRPSPSSAAVGERMTGLLEQLPDRALPPTVQYLRAGEWLSEDSAPHTLREHRAALDGLMRVFADSPLPVTADAQPPDITDRTWALLLKHEQGREEIRAARAVQRTVAYMPRLKAEMSIMDQQSAAFLAKHAGSEALTHDIQDITGPLNGLLARHNESDEALHEEIGRTYQTAGAPLSPAEHVEHFAGRADADHERLGRISVIQVYAQQLSRIRPQAIISAALRAMREGDNGGELLKSFSQQIVEYDVLRWATEQAPEVLEPILSGSVGGVSAGMASETAFLLENEHMSADTLPSRLTDAMLRALFPQGRRIERITSTSRPAHRALVLVEQLVRASLQQQLLRDPQELRDRIGRHLERVRAHQR